eukprot:Amastigsp_a676709_1550.p2 type:complete len:234 gc:universal Amastigsp_a676709_1550:743-42(-)
MLESIWLSISPCSATMLARSLKISFTSPIVDSICSMSRLRSSMIASLKSMSAWRRSSLFSSSAAARSGRSGAPASAAAPPPYCDSRYGLPAFDDIDAARASLTTSCSLAIFCRSAARNESSAVSNSRLTLICWSRRACFSFSVPDSKAPMRLIIWPISLARVLISSDIAFMRSRTCGVSRVVPSCATSVERAATFRTILSSDSRILASSRMYSVSPSATAARPAPAREPPAAA